MRFFIYEHITGGGFLADNFPLEGSLLKEAEAMICAVATDAARVPGLAVVMLRDARLPPLLLPGCEVISVASMQQHRSVFHELSARADRTMLIAPEFDGILYGLADDVAKRGGNLVSPGADFVQVASNKNQTRLALRKNGIPIPHGTLIAQGALLPNDFPYPAVAKPLDGCGSQNIQWIENGCIDLHESLRRADFLLEQFVSGQAASVAVLCGPQQYLPLPPCTQRLAPEANFAYLGGKTPLSPELEARAQRLALSATRALPKACGYIGIDLILGENPNGSDDVVIEINPRLTTSYVGLRELISENLVAAMFAIACGETCHLTRRNVHVEFEANGIIAIQ